MGAAQCLFGRVAFDAFGAQVDQHHMRIGAASDDIQTALHQLIGQRLRVLDHLCLIGLEFRAQRLAKGHGLARDHMHQRATLNTGEDGGIEFLRQILVIGQDHAAARAAQGFVGGRCGDMGMREGRGVEARRHQTREMRHIDQQIGTDAIGNLAHFREIDDAGDGGPTGDDHLGLVFGSKARDLVIVQQVVLTAHAILDGVEPFAGLVGLGPVSQVAARIQRHAKDRIAGLQQRLEHALIGLRTRIRLHVDIGTIEQLAGTLDGKVFGHVHMFAATVIAAAGIAFGVFVGHHAALGLHHGGRDDVFRRDQLDLLALALEFGLHRRMQHRVARGECFGEKALVADRDIHGVHPLCRRGSG